MSESSFETLEALAASLAFHIARELRTKRDDFYGEIIRIGLEKPTAVPLAEAACVELTVKTEDVKIEVSKTFFPTENLHRLLKVLPGLDQRRSIVCYQINEHILLPSSVEMREARVNALHIWNRHLSCT